MGAHLYVEPFLAYKSTSFFCYEVRVHTHLHVAKEGYFVGCALAEKGMPYVPVSDRVSNRPQIEGNARCLSAFISHES